MRWMVRTLDQAQEMALQDVLTNRGVSWINGFAGSGKSVVAAHACKRSMSANNLRYFLEERVRRGASRASEAHPHVPRAEVWSMS